MSDHQSSNEDGFFERPVVRQSIQWGLLGICVLLVLAEFFYEHHHPHFEWETTFAFQAWIGFFAFVIIVFLGRGLRMIIARPEDYYNESFDFEVEDETSATRETSAVSESTGGGVQ